MGKNENTKTKLFRNPFATEKCDKCGTSYQAGMPACPRCENENSRKHDALPFDEKRMMVPGLELATFLIGWAGFQAIAAIVSIFVQLTMDGSDYQLLVLNYVSYAILLAVLLIVSWKYLPKLLGTLFKKESLFGLVVFWAIIIFDIVWANLISGLQAEENINQETVTTLIDQSPILAIIFTGLIAPFCEEMTYRVGLFTFTKRVNRILAYVAVSILFALIHMHDFTSLNEWLNIPPYAFAGLAFAFAYEQWGLGCSLVAHVTNNVVAVLLSLMA